MFSWCSNVFFLLFISTGCKARAEASPDFTRNGKAMLFAASNLKTHLSLVPPTIFLSKLPLWAWSIGRYRLCIHQQTTMQTKINGPDNIKSPAHQLNPGTFFWKCLQGLHWHFRASRCTPARNAERGDGCLQIIGLRLLFRPIKPLAHSTVMISGCGTYQAGTNRSVKTRLVLPLQVWRKTKIIIKDAGERGGSEAAFLESPYLSVRSLSS